MLYYSIEYYSIVYLSEDLSVDLSVDLLIGAYLRSLRLVVLFGAGF